MSRVRPTNRPLVRSYIQPTLPQSLSPVQ